MIIIIYQIQNTHVQAHLTNSCLFPLFFVSDHIRVTKPTYSPPHTHTHSPIPNHPPTHPHHPPVLEQPTRQTASEVDTELAEKAQAENKGEKLDSWGIKA
jgi:hypothetical protein